jgi:hypothetical protein
MLEGGKTKKAAKRGFFVFAQGMRIVTMEHYRF